MITINLANRKRLHPSDHTEKKASVSFSLDSLKSMFSHSSTGGSSSGPSDFPLRKILTAIIIAAGANIFVDSEKQTAFKTIDMSLKKKQAESQVLDEELQKTSGYEQVKINLEQDRFTLASKIETIQKLLTGRQECSKILVALAKGLPDKAWLSFINLKADKISVEGNSLDFNLISDYMESLGQQIYFPNIMLKKSQKEQQDQIDVAKFEIESSRGGVVQ